MNTKIVVGLVAFGALILISSLLPQTDNNNEPSNTEPTLETLPLAVTNDFPTYPNSKLTNQRQSTNDDGTVFYSLSLEAEASIKEINEWYRESLSRGGWSIKSDKNVAGYQIIQAEKDNLFTSMQAAGGQSPQTSVISQQAQIRNQ